MILWTLQHPIVWQTLQQTGCWTADENHIAFPEDEDTHNSHLHYAYIWYARQMVERIGPAPKGVTFPVWAYYKQQSRKDGKPDMRSSYGPSGEPCVRIKIEVPGELVLLSDFDDWHSPLNYCYLSKTEQDSENFDAWYKSMGIDYFDIGDFSKDSLSLTKIRECVERSWEYVFELDEPRDSYWHFPQEKQSIQATFWELRLENVLSVEYFRYR